MEQQTTFRHGDCLEIMRSLPDRSINLIITSPPYNLKGTGGGTWRARFGGRGEGEYNYRFKEGYANFSDDIPDHEYVAWQQAVLIKCWRLLTDDGVIFYNHKNLHRNKKILKADRCIPIELKDYLRQEIVWDRSGSPNWNAAYFLPKTERIFVLAKPDWKILVNKCIGWGDVWKIAPVKISEHPCPFPEEIPRRAISSGCPEVGTVLDPFCGSGTTNFVAQDLGRKSIGIDIDLNYLNIAIDRCAQKTIFC
jgi:site-specific DNA-methyltransferase (adenine-specific)